MNEYLVEFFDHLVDITEVFMAVTLLADPLIGSFAGFAKLELETQPVCHLVCQE